MRKKIEYAVITATECPSLVSDWMANGHSWHFHMLPPSCAYNPLRRNSHCLLLENITDSRNVAILSDRPQRELGMQLAKLVHRDVFDPPGGQPPAVWFDSWRERLANRIENKIDWHHHLFPPICVLNGESGWLLVLEDESITPSAVKRCCHYPGPEFRFIERLVWRPQQF
jgi:hypothetical protein